MLLPQRGRRVHIQDRKELMYCDWCVYKGSDKMPKAPILNESKNVGVYKREGTVPPPNNNASRRLQEWCHVLGQDAAHLLTLKAMDEKANVMPFSAALQMNLLKPRTRYGSHPALDERRKLSSDPPVCFKGAFFTSTLSQTASIEMARA